MDTSTGESKGNRLKAPAGAGARFPPRAPAHSIIFADMPARPGIIAILLAAYWIGFQAIYFLFAALDRPDMMPDRASLWLTGLLSYMTRPAEIAICAVGASTCFLIYITLRHIAAERLFLKIIIALVVSLLASFAFAVANTYELGTGQIESPQRPYGIELARQTLLWLAPFGFWSGIAMVVTHTRLVQSQQQRLALLHAEAQQAKLHALTYQLSPHFLFNTLNSISWMIWEKEWQGAEKMIVNFSEFLRTTLMLDPAEDVPFHQELDLQRAYLAIEQVRFSDRLRVEFNVPDALADLPVPALILQPLVENAIKHGVARSSKPVHIAITAETFKNMLMVSIANDGAFGRGTAGTGLGLANVQQRLQARYGDDAALKTEELADGFRATICMPLR